MEMDCNFDQLVCCICRNVERKATKSIYSKGRLQGYNDCCTIADIIFDLTNIKYIQNENDRQLICGECIFYVTKYYVLQQNCLRIHKQKENNLPNENPNSSNCRCCGKGSEEKYYNVMINLKTVNDILRDLTNIEINDNDLTSSICQKCEKKLIAFESFCKELEKNYNQFQNSNVAVNGDVNEEQNLEEIFEAWNQDAEIEIVENGEKLSKTNKASESSTQANINMQNGNLHSEMLCNYSKNEIKVNYKIDPNKIDSNENCIGSSTLDDDSNRYEMVNITDDHNYVEKIKNGNTTEIDAAKKLLNNLKYKPRKKTSEVDKNRIQKIQCKLCNKILADKRSFRQHLETHSAEPSFGCNDCNEKFYTQKLLESHRKIKHTNEIYNCSLCDRKYLQLNSLRVHVKYTHLGEELPFTCDVCGKKSATKGMLERHRLIHFDTYDYSCQHCSKKFKLKGILKKHLEIHAKDRDFYCNLCPKTFTNQFALAKHEKTHLEISSETTECESNKSTLKAKAKDNKKYSCYLCKDKLRDFEHYEQHFKVFHMHYIEDFNSRRNELINLEI